MLADNPRVDSTPADDMPADVLVDELRNLLASLSGRPDLRTTDPAIPLFGAGIGLDSLTGTLLLREVHRRYGVDVAAEDLNLDALASLATLASFIQTHRE
jgi:hypothetical protein